MGGSLIPSEIRSSSTSLFGSDVVRVNGPTRHILRGKDGYIDPTAVLVVSSNIRLGIG